MTPIYTPPMGTSAGYPAFLPDDSGLLFEQEVRASAGDAVMVTRNNARSQIEWLKPRRHADRRRC